MKGEYVFPFGTGAFLDELGDSLSRTGEEEVPEVVGVDQTAHDIGEVLIGGQEGSLDLTEDDQEGGGVGQGQEEGGGESQVQAQVQLEQQEVPVVLVADAVVDPG